MISALWSNPNYDAQEEGEDPPRNTLIEEIEESYSKVIKRIVKNLPLKDPEPSDERPPDDPFGFFAAGRRGEEKLYKRLVEPSVDKNTTVQEVIDINHKELDQG